MKASKVAFQPVGLGLGILGGSLAGAAFKKTWQLLGNEGDAPDAMDQDRLWREILLAAAIQGAIYGLVKAAVHRGGAIAVHRVTGSWPA